MNDRHGCVGEPIRQPDAEVFALIEPVMVREALGHYGRLDHGRGNIGEREVILRPSGNVPDGKGSGRCD